MAKVAKKHVTAINAIMLKTLAQYITVFAGARSADTENLSMYAEDVAHNVNGLCSFNKQPDAMVLHDCITRQDTIVREFFIDALRYIEDNELIAERYFTCI